MTRGPGILLVRFSSLGDVILTTPLVRALRHAMPRATITFTTKHTPPFSPAIPTLTGRWRWNRVEGVRSLAARFRSLGSTMCWTYTGVSAPDSCGTIFQIGRAHV